MFPKIIESIFNSKQALLRLVENWRKSLDNKGFGGAVSVFDTLNHNFLIAKLHAYSFQHEMLKLLHSYYTTRWHRTKVSGMSFS